MPYGRNGLNNALYGISPNGYMDSKLFKKWVEKVSLSDTPFATTTIIDSGWLWVSYMNIDMIDLLVENNIHLYCLPPQTIIQLNLYITTAFGTTKTWLL